MDDILEIAGNESASSTRVADQVTSLAHHSAFHVSADIPSDDCRLKRDAPAGDNDPPTIPGDIIADGATDER